MLGSGILKSSFGGSHEIGTDSCWDLLKFLLIVEGSEQVTCGGNDTKKQKKKEERGRMTLAKAARLLASVQALLKNHHHLVLKTKPRW